MRNEIPQITSQTISSEIVEILRKEIVMGRFKPGERLIETELAESLNTSRAPLREAIRTLIAEGLLLSEPHRGTFVIELTKQDVEEIYEARLALECAAAKRLCRNMTPEDEKQLRGFIDAFKVRSDQHEDVKLYDLDMRFHEAICTLSGNRRLAEAWSRLGSQLRMLFVTFVRKYSLEDFHARHQEILDALVSGDIELVQQVLRDHMRDAVDRTLNDFHETS
jgi:DNA-binding GntR family transcriptional regulator